MPVEPLSIAGSIGAFFALATQMIPMINDIQDAPDIILNVGKAISNLRAVLQLINSQLAIALPPNVTATLQDTLNDCRDITQDFQEILKPYLESAGRDQRPRLLRWGSWKWAMGKEKEVEKKLRTLEAHKSTLSLQLQVIEILNKRGKQVAGDVAPMGSAIVALRPDIDPPPYGFGPSDVGKSYLMPAPFHSQTLQTQSPASDHTTLNAPQSFGSHGHVIRELFAISEPGPQQPQMIMGRKLVDYSGCLTDADRVNVENEQLRQFHKIYSKQPPKGQNQWRLISVMRPWRSHPDLLVVETVTRIVQSPLDGTYRVTFKTFESSTFTPGDYPVWPEIAC